MKILPSLFSVNAVIKSRKEKENKQKEKTVFTEEEMREFLKPYATNNYLWEKQEIDGKTYYIKLN